MKGPITVMRTETAEHIDHQAMRDHILLDVADKDGQAATIRLTPREARTLANVLGGYAEENGE